MVPDQPLFTSPLSFIFRGEVRSPKQMYKEFLYNGRMKGVGRQVKMIRILSLSTHFLPLFLIPHPKPRNQMTTDEMSSKQVRQAAPRCHRPPDHWEEDVAGERHRSRGTDRRPPRLAAPPRPPQLARVAGGHSPAPGRTAAGGGRGLGRARSCCRGDGLRRSDRLGSHFWVEPSEPRTGPGARAGQGRG